MTSPPDHAGGYGDDLATVHHEGFGQVAREAAAFLLHELGRPDGRLVVDLGCGSGIVAAALTAAGWDVLGVDRSPAMLALAARTAPAARFVEGSVHDVPIPACAAVTAVGEVVNYAFDGREGPAAVRALLARIHAALPPGGLFVFDSAAPGRAGPRGRTERWSEADGWAIHATAVEDPGRDTLVRTLTLFRRDGTLWRRTDERHELHLIPPGDLRAMLREAGFSVRPRRSYGGLRLPGWSVFVARRQP